MIESGTQESGTKEDFLYKYIIKPDSNTVSSATSTISNFKNHKKDKQVFYNQLYRFSKKTRDHNNQRYKRSLPACTEADLGYGTKLVQGGKAEEETATPICCNTTKAVAILLKQVSNFLFCFTGVGHR